MINIRENTHVKYYDSPAGRLAMVTDGRALKGLLLEKEVIRDEIKETEGRPSEGAAKVFRLTEIWLHQFFTGKTLENPVLKEENGRDEKRKWKTYALNVKGESLLLEPEGSDFRQEVWRILCEIPYGETVTYGDIAGEMAIIRGKKKMSAQAVGGAVGHNPISIMIPCHRVVGAEGKLTGYGGGLPVKEKLLKLEGAI